MQLLISNLRIKSNMTQTELGRRIHVSSQVINNWENGRAVPRTEKLPEIAAALGCSIDDLFPADAGV